MSEDRRRILAMLSEGKISVDDAERLMAALDPGPAGSAAPVGAGATGPRKYLRVVVDAVDEGKSKATNVNVRIPLQLLRAGVRLTSLLPSEARGNIDRALKQSGVNFDLGRLKPENVDELIEALGDTTVDIDAAEDRAKVKVYCE